MLGVADIITMCMRSFSKNSILHNMSMDGRGAIVIKIILIGFYDLSGGFGLTLMSYSNSRQVQKVVKIRG